MDASYDFMDASARDGFQARPSLSLLPVRRPYLSFKEQIGGQTKISEKKNRAPKKIKLAQNPLEAFFWTPRFFAQRRPGQTAHGQKWGGIF